MISEMADSRTTLMSNISEKLQLLNTLAPRANIDYLQYTSTMLQYFISTLERRFGDGARTGEKRNRTHQPGRRKKKRLGTTVSTKSVDQVSSSDQPESFTLVSLCRYSSAVVESVLFPFLGLQDHVHLACTSSVLLLASGLLPPPYPNPPSPPLPRHVCKPGAWRKLIVLPKTVTDSRLKAFCNYARRVDQLNLAFCTKLVDISALGNILTLHTLSLRGCDQLTDISALGNIPTLHTLNLGHCGRLTDVSALGNIPTLHTLDLSGCSQLTDVSALGNIPTLHTLDLS
jgi:hypothetical protein